MLFNSIEIRCLRAHLGNGHGHEEDNEMPFARDASPTQHLVGFDGRLFILHIR